MLSKKEIEEISIHLLRKHGLKTKVKFLNFDLFEEKAKKSPIINQSLQEGNSLNELNIPALISHEENTIYFSEETLRNLLLDEPISIQTRFVKAVILHEIFHILNKQHIKAENFNSALRLEEKATRQFRKNYPALEALGRRICKKYIS